MAAGSTAFQNGLVAGSEAVTGSDYAAPTGVSGGLMALEEGLSTQDPQAALATGREALGNSLSQGQMAARDGANDTRVIVTDARGTGVADTADGFANDIAGGVGGGSAGLPVGGAPSLPGLGGLPSAGDLPAVGGGLPELGMLPGAGDLPGLSIVPVLPGPGGLPLDPASIQALVSGLLAQLDTGSLPGNGGVPLPLP